MNNMAAITNWKHPQKEISRMDAAEKADLINKLWLPDRALCHECLRDWKDHPEHLCVFQPGHARCDACASKGIYCLRMRVNETRPLFRTVQKFAAEMGQLIIQGHSVPDRMRIAYRTVVEGALSYADAVRDIKNLNEEADRLAAEHMRTLRQGRDCRDPNEALNWTIACGWTVAKLDKEERRYIGLGGEKSKGGMREVLREVKELRSSKTENEHRVAKLNADLAALRAEKEELAKSRAAAAATRDRLVEELKNSKASVLAAEAALERSSLERASKREFEGKSYVYDKEDEDDDVEECQLIVMEEQKVDQDLFQRLPERIKQRIFQFVLTGIPSVERTMRERHRMHSLSLTRPHGTTGCAAWTGMGVDNIDAAIIAILYHAGKNMDMNSEHAVVNFISNNALSMSIHGLEYRWAKADHETLLNVCLVTREWMARVIRTQVMAFVRIVQTPPRDPNRRSHRANAVSVNSQSPTPRMDDQDYPSRKRQRSA